jgi:hypothetical protein
MRTCKGIGKRRGRHRGRDTGERHRRRNTQDKRRERKSQ